MEAAAQGSTVDRPLGWSWSSSPAAHHGDRLVAAAPHGPPPWHDLQPFFWSCLLQGLEHGQSFRLDPAALERALRAARTAGLHLRPTPIEPPKGCQAPWFRLTATTAL